MTVSNDPRGDSRLAAETVSLSMSTSKTTSVSFQDARLSAMRRSRDLPSLYGVSPREFAKSGEFALTKEGASTGNVAADKDPDSKDEAEGLGVVKGVFFPCLQNILGIILFIRTPNITGSAGVFMAVVIVLVCCTTTFCTALSMSALATAGKVGSGGPYNIMSRNMGPEFGGAVTFFFYLGTTVASAMYILGAVEVAQANIPAMHPGFLLECTRCQVIVDAQPLELPCVDSVLAGYNVTDTSVSPPSISPYSVATACTISLNEARLFGTLLSIAMATFVSMGVAVVSSIAPIFLYVVLASVFMIYLGFVATSCYDRTFDIPGLTGFKMSNLEENFWPPEDFFADFPGAFFTAPPFSGAVEKVWKKDVFFLFGLFFPSVTGIMAGCNRSGKLANPSQALPKGTLMATSITTFIYLTQTVLWGAMATRSTLQNEKYLAAIVPAIAWPFSTPVAAGVAFSTVGAGLQSLVGAPMLLQTMAEDRTLPFLACIADRPTEKQKQLLSLFCTWCISECCILMGDLENINPLITMFFLLCYMGINYSLTTVARLNLASFRTSFTCYHWMQSAVGVFLCFFVMLMTNWFYCFVSLSFAFLLSVYIGNGELPGWARGDAKRAQNFKKVRHLLFDMEVSKIQGVNAYKNPGVKNWRPQVLAFVGIREEQPVDGGELALSVVHPALLAVCTHLKHGHGLAMVGGVLLDSEPSSGSHVSGSGPRRKRATEHLEDVLRQGCVVVDGERVKFAEEYQKGHGYCMPKAEQLTPFKAFVTVVTAKDQMAGQTALVQMAGMGAMVPNTVLAAFPADWRLRPAAAIALLHLHTSALDEELAFLLLNEEGSHTRYPLSNEASIGTSRDEFVDIWLNVYDGGLLLMLPYILRRHVTWKDAKIRVFIVTKMEVVSDEALREGLKSNIKAKLADLRLTVHAVQVVGLPDPEQQDMNDAEQFWLQAEREVGEHTKEVLHIATGGVAMLTQCGVRNKLMKGFSKTSSTRLVLTNLPPVLPASHDAVWCAGVEKLCEGMPPVLFCHGVSQVVTAHGGEDAVSAYQAP